MVGSILKNFSKLLSGNFASSFISLITITIISTSLGFKEFGYFILCQSSYMLVEQIFNIRGWQLYISEGRVDKDDLKVLFGINNGLNGIAFLISSVVIVFIYWGGWVNSDQLSYSILYIILILFRNYDSAYVALRIRNRYGILSILNTLMAVARLSITLTVDYFLTLDVGNIILIFVATEIIYYFCLNFFASKLTGSYISSVIVDYKTMKRGFHINLSSIFDLPINVLDSYIVNYFFGPEFLGGYKLLRKYVTILGRIVSPLNQVVFPVMVELDNKGRNVLSGKVIVSTFLVTSLISIMSYNALFNFKFEIFSDLKLIDSFDPKALFAMLLSIEVISLSFSVFNFYLVTQGGNLKNSICVAIANVVFIGAVIAMGEMSMTAVATMALALLTQSILLISLRLIAIYR